MSPYVLIAGAVAMMVLAEIVCSRLRFPPTPGTVQNEKRYRKGYNLGLLFLARGHTMEHWNQVATVMLGTVLHGEPDEADEAAGWLDATLR